MRHGRFSFFRSEYYVEQQMTHSLANVVFRDVGRMEIFSNSLEEKKKTGSIRHHLR